MSSKFCPDCGTANSAQGSFCGACGKTLEQAPPAGAGPFPLAGLVTLVTLLVLGGGFWLYLQFAPTPQRPLKPGERAPGVAASNTAPAAAPRAPMQLPDDIKAYMANLQKEADENPEDTEKWATLAGVYYRASRLDRSYTASAESAYQHLLDRDPKDAEALRGLGNLAYDRKDRPLAISYYERYLAQKPTDSEVRTDLGTMYYESQQTDEAIAAYERVLATNPNFYQAHFNLAVVYDAGGDRERSRAALAKARDLASDEAVKERIGTLLEIAQSRDLSLTAAAALVSQTAPPAPVQPDAAPADSFRGAVEALFRGHRIAGPKVVAIEWPSEDRARVLMANFPMGQMPEVMKIGYLGKMKTGVIEAQEKFQREQPLRVELVDQTSGDVMATVDSAESSK